MANSSYLRVVGTKWESTFVADGKDLTMADVRRRVRTAALAKNSNCYDDVATKLFILHNMDKDMELVLVDGETGLSTTERISFGIQIDFCGWIKE